MPEIDDKINSSGTLLEPPPNEIGFCSICDVEISTYDAPEGICAVCLGDKP